jgi:hypothetical protein
MNKTQGQPVEVIAYFDIDGYLTPLSFTQQGHTYAVDASGRRWQDDAGQHFLVMAPGERIFELVFDPATLRWYLQPRGPAIA